MGIQFLMRGRRSLSQANEPIWMWEVSALSLIRGPSTHLCPSLQDPTLFQSVMLTTRMLQGWDFFIYASQWYDRGWILFAETCVLRLLERSFFSWAYLETFLLFMGIHNWEILSLRSFFSFVTLSRDVRSNHSAWFYFLHSHKFSKVLYLKPPNSLLSSIASWILRSSHAIREINNCRFQ